MEVPVQSYRGLRARGEWRKEKGEEREMEEKKKKTEEKEK